MRKARKKQPGDSSLEYSGCIFIPKDKQGAYQRQTKSPDLGYTKSPDLWYSFMIQREFFCRYPQ